ncbi:hypothetical protein ACSU64_05120 [Bacillaceae bacterium C204]|uniref:hypothetical protein n=1 Tax=Neobacillus sp. 204 TaxID=3383351 RepID=UPI00397AB12A
MEIEKIYGDLPILETERLILRKMTFEGILRKGIYIKDKHQDLKMYSILKEEFQT